MKAAIDGVGADNRIFVPSNHAYVKLNFLFGGDKLKTFEKWKTFDEFVRKYQIIVFKREDSDPEAEINKTTTLCEHKEAFIILPSPSGIEHISPTAVRE